MIIDAAAGTIIGGLIVGAVVVGFRVGWKAVDPWRQRFAYRIGAGALVTGWVIVWLALAAR